LMNSSSPTLSEMELKRHLPCNTPNQSLSKSTLDVSRIYESFLYMVWMREEEETWRHSRPATQMLNLEESTTTGIFAISGSVAMRLQNLRMQSSPSSIPSSKLTSSSCAPFSTCALRVRPEIEKEIEIEIETEIEIEIETDIEIQIEMKIHVEPQCV
jgi:hypothetical protein